jgi:hypothetical protein
VIPFEIFELTLDKAKTIIAPPGYVIMLGWWSEGGYHQYMEWRGAGGYGGTITGDAIPAYCIVPENLVVNPREYITKYDNEVGVDHRLDIGAFGKNIIGVLDARQGNSTQNYLSPLKPYGAWVDQFAAVSETEFDKYARGVVAIHTYGFWFRADSIPNHVGDVRFGCRWWQAGFPQLKQAGIDAAITFNRAANKADNAQMISNIVSFLTFNPYGIAANIASQTNNEELQNIGQIYKYANIADNLTSGALSTSLTDNLTQSLELGVTMDELDFSAATTDYASAFPDFGENPGMDVFFNDGLQGSIINNGDTFTGPDITAPPDVQIVQSDFAPVSDTPFSPNEMDATATNVFNDGGSNVYSTPDSPASISGISPSALINGGRQIYTMSQSGNTPTRSPVGGNNQSAQIQTNAGSTAPNQTLSQTINEWMRNAGTVARTVSAAAGGVAKLQNTVKQTQSNIKAVNAPSPYQMGQLRQINGIQKPMQIPVGLMVLGGLGVAYALAKSKG